MHRKQPVTMVKHNMAASRLVFQINEQINFRPAKPESTIFITAEITALDGILHTLSLNFFHGGHFALKDIPLPTLILMKNSGRKHP